MQPNAEQRLTPGAFFAKASNAARLDAIADGLPEPLKQELQDALTRLANLYAGVTPSQDAQEMGEIPAEHITHDEMRALLGRVYASVEVGDKPFIQEVAQMLSVLLLTARDTINENKGVDREPGRN